MTMHEVSSILTNEDVNEMTKDKNMIKDDEVVIPTKDEQEDTAVSTKDEGYPVSINDGVVAVSTKNEDSPISTKDGVIAVSTKDGDVNDSTKDEAATVPANNEDVTVSTKKDVHEDTTVPTKDEEATVSTKDEHEDTTASTKDEDMDMDVNVSTNDEDVTVSTKKDICEDITDSTKGATHLMDGDVNVSTKGADVQVPKEADINVSMNEDASVSTNDVDVAVSKDADVNDLTKDVDVAVSKDANVNGLTNDVGVAVSKDADVNVSTRDVDVAASRDADINASTKDEDVAVSKDADVNASTKDEDVAVSKDADVNASTKDEDVTVSKDTDANVSAGHEDEDSNGLTEDDDCTVLGKDDDSDVTEHGDEEGPTVLTKDKDVTEHENENEDVDVLTNLKRKAFSIIQGFDYQAYWTTTADNCTRWKESIQQAMTKDDNVLTMNGEDKDVNGLTTLKRKAFSITDYQAYWTTISDKCTHWKESVQQTMMEDDNVFKTSWKTSLTRWNQSKNFRWSVIATLLLLIISTFISIWVRSPSPFYDNYICESPQVIQPWQITAFRPKWFGTFGGPGPITHKTRGGKGHRVSIVDIDRRDIEIATWIDGKSVSHRPVVLDNTVSCGEDLANCINMGFGAAIVSVPPGKHTIKAEIRDVNGKFKWEHERKRRVWWMVEQCS